MPVSSLRSAVVVVALLASPLAASTATAATGPAPAGATVAHTSPRAGSFTWQPLALPAGAQSCFAGAASQRGDNYLLTCMSLPEDRSTVVVTRGKIRKLADTVGGQRFAQIFPHQVNDAGWVYGTVGNGATDETGGWTLARWTPTGQLQLAPQGAESATHHNPGVPTTSENYAAVRAVNDRGDAIVDVRTMGTLKGSSWVWQADGTLTPINPVNPGRRAEAVGIANDGTVVFNDREDGMDEFLTPLPYRRLPNGSSVPLDAAPGHTAGVHDISPSGQHVVGRVVVRGNHHTPWLRWDGPTFAPVTHTPMEESDGHAVTVLDNGDYLAGESLVRGTVETKIYALLASSVPTGTVAASDMVADGRILTTITFRDAAKEPAVGWLVPTPNP